MENAADARLARHPDAALHHAHQPRADGQPKTGTSVSPRDGSVSLCERIEDGDQLFLGDADASVADLKVHRRAPIRTFLKLHVQVNLAGIGEFDRVTKQV